jgi:hypothetical protein
MFSEIVNSPVAVGACVLLYIVSALAFIRSAAFVGLAPRLTNAIPWLTRSAKHDSSLRKVRITSAGFGSFFAATYLLYVLISAR